MDERPQTPAFQSSPGFSTGCNQPLRVLWQHPLVSILTRLLNRMQLCFNGDCEESHDVSILTRLLNRMQHAPVMDERPQTPAFQSSPGFSTGCNQPLRVLWQHPLVSILTRLLNRMQR